MRMYDTLIACLVKYKNFKEIKKDEFLHSLYQIWDMVFWDDEDDISPMKAKYLASRISKFLKIDLLQKVYKNIFSDIFTTISEESTLKQMFYMLYRIDWKKSTDIIII